MTLNLLLVRDAQLYIDVISVVAPIIGAALVPLLVYIFTIRRENKFQLIEKFKRIYTNTFALRNTISKNFESKLIDNNFYYETDQILNNTDITECILDYLTEMEDLFYFAINGRRLNDVFKNLMSYALYSRLSYFYGLIIKLRAANNNANMFPKYIEVLEKVEKLNKIKCQFKIYNKIYYIGIRQSDIDYSRNYFKGCIAMFSKSDGAKYTMRPNQNKPCHEFFPYLERIYNSKHLNVKDKYMTYNPTIAYGLDNKMHNKFICLNDSNLINFLNDKCSCKLWLNQNEIPIVEFKTESGNEIIKKGLEIFKEAEMLVFQSNHGGGGIGTFVVSKQNFDAIKNKILPLKQYMISKYLPNSISVNAHIFISEKQTVLSPASIQIIEMTDSQLCYRGADYIAFDLLPQDCKSEIKRLSFKIANLLRDKNYRGVAGIDFIVDKNGKVYCSEINPRFQASSILLDNYLANSTKKEKIAAKSIYELNEQAFKNNMKTSLSFEDKISLSCYYYYKEDLSLNFFENKINIFKQNDVIIDLDGLSFDDKFDNNSYMFRAVFNHQICSISPDNELWINNNIRIEKEPEDITQLKIALLNQGVRLSKTMDNVKVGVYNSIDISFSGNKFHADHIDINCAVDINLSRYSPFLLNLEDNKLYYYNIELGTFDIEYDMLSDFSEYERKILYLATDRLRIKLTNGCEYKNRGLGCKFCNVPPSIKHFSINDIKSALKKLKEKNIAFRHILIGGGTCLDEKIWDEIIELAKFLKSDKFFADKPISLMSIFPPSDKLSALKDAGIVEVAFNLEIADEELAKKYMPGKYNSKEYFYNRMNEVVKVFGRGNVRSALLVGLDKHNNLINMVNEMAKNNIIPCLSAFRALPNAGLGVSLHPTNEYLYMFYIESKEMLGKSSSSIKELGPSCKRCGNNMLII